MSSPAERYAAARQRTRQQTGAVGRFTAAHPDIAQVQVPAGAHDVNDLDELREIAADLAAG